MRSTYKHKGIRLTVASISVSALFFGAIACSQDTTTQAKVDGGRVETSQTTVDTPDTEQSTVTTSENPATTVYTPSQITTTPATETSENTEPSQHQCIPNELTPSCWNTLPDVEGVTLPVDDHGEVTAVQAMSRPALDFDTVTFPVSTDKNVRFDVRYVDVARHQGSGLPIDVDGGAVLQVTIFAPSPHPNNFPNPTFTMDGDGTSLSEVKFGGSFEGQTTFAIGVNHKVPFAAIHNDASTQHKDQMNITIYLAHQ